jgi:hypothetical protein
MAHTSEAAHDGALGHSRACLDAAMKRDDVRSELLAATSKIPALDRSRRQLVTDHITAPAQTLEGPPAEGMRHRVAR